MINLDRLKEAIVKKPAVKPPVFCVEFIYNNSSYNGILAFFIAVGAAPKIVAGTECGA